MFSFEEEISCSKNVFFDDELFRKLKTQRFFFNHSSICSRFLFSDYLFFHLSRFFSNLLKTFWDFFKKNLYFHIWVLDFFPIVENLESWKLIVNDTEFLALKYYMLLWVFQNFIIII